MSPHGQESRADFVPKLMSKRSKARTQRLGGVWERVWFCLVALSRSGVHGIHGGVPSTSTQ